MTPIEKERKGYAQLVEMAISGESNPLDLYIQLKAQEVAISEALEMIKPLATQEADKYPENSFMAFGGRVEKKSVGARWDYSGVSEWVETKNRLAQIEAIAKVGGADESGNEIQKAEKKEGAKSISISFK